MNRAFTRLGRTTSARGPAVNNASLQIGVSLAVGNRGLTVRGTSDWRTGRVIVAQQ